VEKRKAIQAIGAMSVLPVKVVEDQTVMDIVEWMPVAHDVYRRMYDRLVWCVEETELESLCYELWDFCRATFKYKEESVDDQQLSAPSTMLKRGWSDCKSYALFIGGMLDALNRQGADIRWKYRYVASTPWGNKIGHVFVVVDPDNENIWVDPVLPDFDKHFFYLVHRDVEIQEVGAMGRIGGLRPVMSARRVGASAEQNILDQLEEYTLGLTQAVQVSQSSGTINTITQGVVQTASALIPGVSLALGILKAVGTEVSNIFGVGSTAARLVADVTNNLLMAPVAIVETLLSPGSRTFESDQYYGAAYYYYYVQGQAKYKNAPSQVADTQVPVALKWFIDRLGVFISGREHIEALVQGAAQYLALHSVNAYTTTDPTAVANAVAVAQQYFNFNGNAGSWAGTVGVFDVQLIEIANEMGETVETAAAQDAAGELGSDAPPVYASQAGTATLQNIITDPITLAAAAALLLLWILD
jgi:hypothetical protein